MANRYTKALKHLKNKTLDEKLELLEALPTNNTTGLYVDTPGFPDPETITPGDIDSALDLNQDGDGEEGYVGKDTTGLFESDGTIRAIEPPGDTSYILGPMISMWYAWANYTQIGYVRQSDRKMVNLGRITGELDDWDGSSGFTSYGQLSVEQAAWYKNQSRQDYRAFYPGPPSNPADEYGRYIGSIIAESKPTTIVVPQNPFKRYTPGTSRLFDPTDNFSLAMDRGGAAVGIGMVIWMGIEGAKAIKGIIDSLTPEQRERLFDNSTSQFGDTDAAGRSAETNIGYEMASARGPYGTPGADKPYVRRGYKDKDGKFVDFDNPATWPSIVPKLPRAKGTTTNPYGGNTVAASYKPEGRFISEQASGGGTITAHTDAGDVTINIPSNQEIQELRPPQRGMQTTPESGVATDYSKNQLRVLQAQQSEYFVSGWIQGTAAGTNGPAELEKMFAGTTVSWYQVVRMTDEIAEIKKAKTEANERASEIWDEVHPQITSLLAQMRSINLNSYAVYYGQYLPLVNEVDRLFALHDNQTEVCMRLAKQHLDMSGRLGRYVQSGKLVDPDPFNLNDPTIKKEKELDEQEISDLIAELKKAATDAQRAALLNKLKAFGYGALLAAGAVLGFKLLLGGAGLKALGAPLVNLLRKLAPKVKPIKTPKPTSSLDDGLDQLLKNMPISGKPKPTMAQQSKIDAFHRVVGDPKTLTRATDAVSKAPSGFKNEVAIEIVVQGKKIMVKAADILRNKGFQVNSHQPSGKLLTESQKRALRNVKKPVQVKEIPTKVKVKPTGRKNKTVGVDMMKTPNVPNQFKPPAPNIWSTSDKKKNERASQEKKNEVLELVGAAEHHWTYLTEDRRRQKQEKVNEMMSAEFDKQMELLYEKHKIKESKVDKVISAFRKPTDIAPEYPKTAPPEMDPNTGMHPKYGKKYKHDKLDPHSAEFMPPTGDPVIDANIKKATNAKEKARKLKILLGKRA